MRTWGAEGAARLGSAALAIVLAAPACGLVRDKRYFVPSASMEPSIAKGDRITCSRDRPRTIRRGMVVLYRDRPAPGPGPAAPRAMLFVKRVIGLPGEEVRGDADGTVRVDGRPLVEPYADKTGSIPFEPVRVGTGELFVVGDNRDGSSDSRFNGPLAADKVIAACTRIVSPRAHRGRIPGTP